MTIDIVTIFPGMFSPVLEESIIKRSQEKGLATIRLHDLRDYANNKHNKIDAPSYGGGGMVFKAEPFFLACEKIIGASLYPEKKRPPDTRIVLMSPQGKTLTQKVTRSFLAYKHLVILAPRYEGVDERVHEYLVDEEISLGDYILSGAELASMVFVDCLIRLIPGVVSDPASIENESFEMPYLDYPHYTKPPDFRGLKVPEVLQGGDHGAIEEWRKVKAIERTKKRRPDLLAKGEQ